MNTLVEIVCCTVDDAIAAEAGGADRIELCSALQVGGLTPSLGLLRAVKAQVSIPVMAMVRPRPSGFCYSSTEFSVMCSDAQSFVESGADGVVFGCLTAERDVDTELTRVLVEIAGTREAVFHRAFDVTQDPIASLGTLIVCGVSRVLTSGQAETALLGAVILRRLRETADGRIQILPGGGIRAHNAQELVALTGCHQIHLAPRSPRNDPTAASSTDIDYGGDGIVTAVEVAEVVSALAGTEA